MDAYAATLPEFGLKPSNISYLKAAAEMGLGEMDLNKIKIIEKELK